MVAPNSNLSDVHHGPVLITGTSTGIGRACAIRLARQGWPVIAGVRTDVDARSIEQAGKETTGGIRAVQIDVADGDSVQRAGDLIRQWVAGSGLNAFVNNAGICVVGPAECVTIDQWRYQFEVNLIGVLRVTQAMLPLVRDWVAARGPGSGRVVNMGSITGEIATPLFGAYSASKFALGAASDALRMELQPEGIFVSTIVPGTIQSEIWRKEKEGVEAMLADPRATDLYGGMIKNIADYVFSCAAKAAPAERVAKIVERCLTVRHPKSRYRVGWEADIGSLAHQFMPDRLFSYLLRKTLGIPAIS